jgi:division/cell wall cluster transcriptional repressor MraZ
LRKSIAFAVGSGIFARGLSIYPFQEWLALEDKVAKGSGFTFSQLNSINRLILAPGVECAADRQGRVLIPPHLRSTAALERDIVFVGAQKKVEIWSQTEWERVISQAEKDFPANTQVAARRGSVVVNDSRIEIAQAAADWQAAKAQAENARKFLSRMDDLAKRELIAKQEFDDALTKSDEAEQKMTSARERYDLLLAGTRKEEVERARQRWAEADAKRRQLRGGFRKEEIAQAKSEMEASRARLEQIQTQLEETVIKAPVDALVEALDLQPGDLVGAGKPVATLLRLGSLWVRAYLPEDRLGFVQPGLKVKVRVDSFPNKDFSGAVRRVHRQGEFTPRNIQTHEERVLQVFQVEVVIDDAEHVLRPGMSADVTIQIR